ncbi:TetR/AcrR family transcriptional regulator [Phenylobacterium soli]|uniref:TetR/AcrR family transcriptional regulator n=1 Tax=Phenylobacterium soli TaxID=2170551 RepID=A0A328ABC3_9CAUL|nr:TetR/AcrR family transcriptional regulator [Phenylobacterium soli]RAK51885.1 TetR/AcrR family transcriptional regulator [Phenylobacterium soli]
MARSYTLKKRAEQQADTRRRIVEAAVDLHSTVGPAATTISMIADRAGVQRQTFYAHFPDDRALAMACSGLAFERDPLPALEPLLALAPGAARLEEGLSRLYGWYERNAQLTACVLRDAEHHVLTREIADLRFGPPMSAYRAALAEGLAAHRGPLLDLAMSYHSWRTLTAEAGLTTPQAAALMTRTLAG